MATEALKSTSITNSDANPIVTNTPGEYAAGAVLAASDLVSSTGGVTVGSTYKVLRIPTNAKIKQVLFSCAAHGGASAFDIDIGYSDSATDGTPANLQSTIVQISAADNKLFGAAVSAVSALKDSDVTFSGTFTAVHRNLPLYQVLLNLGTTDWTSGDPGGMFDIILKSTATDTSGGDLDLLVYYVMGAG